MSQLALVLIGLILLALAGGLLPHFYPGAPWKPGFGFGPVSFSMAFILILLVLLILAFTGHL